MKSIEQLEVSVEEHIGCTRTLAESAGVEVCRAAMWASVERLWVSVSLQDLGESARHLFGLEGGRRPTGRCVSDVVLERVGVGVCELSERFDEMIVGHGAVLQVAREAVSLACDAERTMAGGTDVVDVSGVFYQVLRAVLILEEDAKGFDVALAAALVEMEKQVKALRSDGLADEPLLDLWGGVKLSGWCDL